MSSAYSEGSGSGEIGPGDLRGRLDAHDGGTGVSVFDGEGVEEGAVVLGLGWVSKSRSTFELVKAGLASPLPALVSSESPLPPRNFIPFDPAILACVGVAKLAIVEGVSVVGVLNGWIWLLVIGFDLPWFPLPSALVKLVLKGGGCRFW